MKKQDGFTLTWWHVDLAGIALCVVLTFVGYGIILQPIAEERDRLTAKRNELQQIQQQAQHLRTFVALPVVQKTAGASDTNDQRFCDCQKAVSTFCL